MILALPGELAHDTLAQAIDRGRMAYTPDRLEAALEALHDAPGDGREWQALCRELALYGHLLRERATTPDPRGD